nr:hypothetical protein [Tanacetum cinerariifolium]
MTFKSLYHRVYALKTSKNITVAQKLAHDNMGRSLRRNPRGGVELQQYACLLSNLEGVFLPNMQDSWFWSLSGSGEFFVVSLRRSIDDHMLPKVSSKTKWIKVVPVKVNIQDWKMALPVLNINHSAFRSMYEREELSAQVLAQWNAVYDAYNDVACLILGNMTPKLHRQFENSSPYDMIKELKFMFEKQAGVEWNYNMHNMMKTIDKLHALLIEYEKGLPKKVDTPQVIAIQGARIQKANKKSLNAKGKGKGKEHPAKDDACHHCKEVGHWKMNCLVYLAELIKKKKQVENILSQEVSRRAKELKEIQDKDTSPSENTSEIPMKVEGFEPPQKKVVPVRRSARTH